MVCAGQKVRSDLMFLLFSVLAEGCERTEVT